jgi:hypothetical protein
MFMTSSLMDSICPHSICYAQPSRILSALYVTNTSYIRVGTAWCRSSMFLCSHQLKERIASLSLLCTLDLLVTRLYGTSHVPQLLSPPCCQRKSYIVCCSLHSFQSCTKNLRCMGGSCAYIFRPQVIRLLQITPQQQHILEKRGNPRHNLKYIMNW